MIATTTNSNVQHMYVYVHYAFKCDESNQNISNNAK